MSAQAQMFAPDVEPETASGKSRGPRSSLYIGARLPRFTLELLRSLFQVQRMANDEITESDQAGEVLEAYLVDAAPDVFGISLFEYVKAREAGQDVDLVALFRKRGWTWPQ